MQFSQESQTAITTSINIVKDRKHYTYMPDHLLYALITFLKKNLQEKIREELLVYFSTVPKIDGNPQMEALNRIMYEADKLRNEDNVDFIEVDHLIKVLSKYDIHSETFKKHKEELMETEPELPFLVDLTKQASLGKHDPVIGREESIRSLIEVLSKKTKSNAILVGQPGVGKTAIVHAIAEKIVSGRMQNLTGFSLYSLDVGALLSGTSLRGSFEKKVNELIIFAKQSKRILFIDEVHMILQTKAEGSADAANMLKASLASGEIKVIGATTVDEFRLHVEKDPAFARRFVRINVYEPKVELSITMLRGLKKRIEAHHGVRIEDNSLVEACVLAKKYITNRRLPDSAIDLVDTACASAVVSVESESPEVVLVKEKLWGLSLEKASLEMDLKRKGIQKSEDEKDENVKDLNKKNKMDKINKEIREQSYISIQADDVKKIKERINQINNEIKTLEDKLAPLKAEQEASRKSLEQTKQYKQKIEDYNLKLKQLEGRNEYDAAQIKNYILPTLHDKLEELQQHSITVIKESNIADIVSRWTGIPVNRLSLEDRERLIDLEARLKEKVFGQNEAVKLVADALITSRTGFSDPNKPIAVFLFLGPTGVGKTELAKAVAYEMFDSKSMVSIDCSDYQSEIAITKLVGVSAGYIGYNEGGRLTEPVRNKPYNLVLLDELDLAHRSLFGILYQLFDEGRVVDGKGVEVDFKNCVVIMTSNLGYRGEIREENKSAIEALAVNTLGPALFNRIDALIHFNALDEKSMKNILNAQIKELNERFKGKGIEVKFTDRAKNVILQSSYNRTFGARPLKKYLQREIVSQVAKLSVGTGKRGVLWVDYDESYVFAFND